MKSILIVEDDVTLNDTLAFHLKQNRYEVSSAYTTKSAIDYYMHTTYDLIIIDINLPDGNGFFLCKDINKSKVPKTAIVFLTGNDLEHDVLKGYSLGADDYITKPFSLPIFQKKVSAILNRVEKQYPERKYTDSRLNLNFESMTAFIDGALTEFTPLEFQLLELLIGNAGHIVTRQQILEALWDKRGNYVDESSLNSIICRIRSKIDTKCYRYIKTVYGTGYMWIEGDALETSES